MRFSKLTSKLVGGICTESVKMSKTIKLIVGRHTDRHTDKQTRLDNTVEAPKLWTLFCSSFTIYVSPLLGEISVQNCL